MARRRGASILLAMGLALGVTGAAVANDEFYAGKTVRIVIPAGPGGVYGLYAQVVGPYLREHVPGRPDFVPEYMPGGGGIKAANYIANAAPKDGSVIAMPHDSLVVTQVLTPSAVKYDVRSLRWIGTVSATSSTIAVWHTVGARSVDDAKKIKIVLGATGKGSYMYFVPRLMNSLLGTKFEIVSGYKGVADIDLAIERGEVQGRAGAWLSWKAAKPDWVRDGKVIQLVQFGYRKTADLPSVPLLVDLATDEETAGMFRFVSSIGLIGRGFVAPGGVVESRLAMLRDGLAQTLTDRRFLDETKKRGVDVDSVPGPEVEAGIARMLATPKATVDRLRKLIGK
jgi:tripartite-type tricarboxylate transporter receptor subunit TctC